MRGKGIADLTFPCWMVTAREKKVGLNGRAIFGTFAHGGYRCIERVAWCVHVRFVPTIFLDCEGRMLGP